MLLPTGFETSVTMKISKYNLELLLLQIFSELNQSGLVPRKPFFSFYRASDLHLAFAQDHVEISK